ELIALDDQIKDVPLDGDATAGTHGERGADDRHPAHGTGRGIAHEAQAVPLARTISGTRVVKDDVIDTHVLHGPGPHTTADVDGVELFISVDGVCGVDGEIPDRNVPGSGIHGDDPQGAGPLIPDDL